MSRSEHSPVDGAADVRDAALRAALITQLRVEHPSAAGFTDVASLLGLDPDHRYIAVVGPVDRDGEVEQSLRRAGATSSLRVVDVVIDDQLFALVPGEARLEPGVGATLGAGRRRVLAEAHRSFAEAEHALRTAEAFGIEGVVDLEALSPLPLVTATEELAAYAARDRFAALDALGRAGVDIEQTVLAFFEHDQSVDVAAQELEVHRNTIRARLRRFRDLTGLDIARTEQFVAAWWLLRHRQARRSTGSADDS